MTLAAPQPHARATGAEEPRATPAAYAWQRDVPRTAGTAQRALALAVDLLIVFALAWICTFVAASSGFLRIPDVPVDGQRVPVLGLLYAVSIFELPIFLLYSTLFHAAGGRTPGKLLLGLRVVRVDGAPVRIGDSFLRSLLCLLWVTPVGAAFVLLDAYTLRVTELDQRLGDLAAGTIVVADRGAGAESL